PPISPLFPYTTLFRSRSDCHPGDAAPRERAGRQELLPAAPREGGGTTRRVPPDRVRAAGARLADGRIRPCRDPRRLDAAAGAGRSEEHTSELQSPCNL